MTDHEDGGEMFIRNVGWLSTNYTEDRTLHNHCCENLKSYKLSFYYQLIPYKEHSLLERMIFIIIMGHFPKFSY
jgi:hypothetical protein